jgi:hypothetical protein
MRAVITIHRPRYDSDCLHYYLSLLTLTVSPAAAAVVSESQGKSAKVSPQSRRSEGARDSETSPLQPAAQVHDTT